MLSRRRKRAIIGFVFVGLFVLILFFAVGRFFAGIERRRRLAEEKAELQPRPLNIERVVRETRSRTKRYAAEAEPWVVAEIAAETPGRVAEINAELGRKVEKGDLLLRLDAQVAEAAVKAAQARHRENVRLEKEAGRLAKRDVISQTELEAARARREISKAELDQAREQLEQHFVKAPFEGVINERMVDPGDFVNQNQPLLELIELGRLRIVFFVSEEDILSFEPGQPVRLRLALASEEEKRPEIEFIAKAADPATGLFRIEAALPNTNHQLPGGLTGVVIAEVHEYRDQLFIPAAAVRLEGDEALVLRQTEEGVPEEVAIEIGPEIDGHYPVLAGLKEGDKIIIR